MCMHTILCVCANTIRTYTQYVPYVAGYTNVAQGTHNASINKRVVSQPTVYMQVFIFLCNTAHKITVYTYMYPRLCPQDSERFQVAFSATKIRTYIVMCVLSCIYE